MKKVRFLSLILVLTIFSCNEIKEIKKVEEVKPSINEYTAIINTPSPSNSNILPSPKESVEVNIKSRCLDLSEYNLEKKIHYPLDIVADFNGKFVYVTTNEGLFLEKNNKKTDNEIKFNNKIYYEFYPVEHIYKVYSTGYIEILNKPKDYDNFYCELKHIEKINNNDLIINGSKLFLFKDNNYFNLIDDTIKKPKDSEGFYSIPLINETRRETYSILDIYSESNKLFLTYYFQYNSSEGYNISREFIEFFDIKNKAYNRIYENFKGITDIILHYNNNGFPIIENKSQYAIGNSIYNGQIFYDVSNVVKYEEQLKKVGKIIRIRKDSKNNLIGIDSAKNMLWKIYPDEQKIELIAGNGKEGYKDGKGTEAQFNGLRELDLDKNDNIYITDYNNHAIRKITPDGVVSTFYKEES
ncbi:MAG: hypothetical protein U0457_00540 [Candidatus Sericytochromatia bacterium]